MAIRGVDDVHVAPDEGPAGRGELRLGVRAALVDVRVRVVVAVFLAGARAGRERGEGERKEGRELHPGPGRETRGGGESVGDEEGRSA